MPSESSDRRDHSPDRYLAPGTFMHKIFNPFVAFLTRNGVSIAGSRVLRVKGRKTGEWREVPVNLLHFEGNDYLIAPRGHTQWVRNLRAARSGELRVGKRIETFTAAELPDDEKPPVIREYIRKWKWEIGAFLPGVDEQSSDAELLGVAAGFPAFRVEISPAADG